MRLQMLEALLQGTIFQFTFLDEHNIGRHLENRFRTVLQSMMQAERSKGVQ